MALEKRYAHGCDLRKGRYSIPEQIYSITVATERREPVFGSFARARKATLCLHDPDVARHANTLAHVIMPDHIHWLMQLRTDAQLGNTVRLYKAKVTRRLGRSVWQKGFHDRAIRAEEDILAIARYIVNNPKRAGLVKKISDYPHWDAIWVK